MRFLETSFAPLRTFTGLAELNTYRPTTAQATKTVDRVGGTARPAIASTWPPALMATAEQARQILELNDR
jgi:hypothetical protein